MTSIMLEKVCAKQTTQVFPAVHVPVHRTPGGVPFLRAPGVALMAQPHFNPESFRGFLKGFSEELRFEEYLDEDRWDLPDGDAMVKAAGQLCYMSFGAGRTLNADIVPYLNNIKEGRHGSVTQHPTYSFLLYGMDRANSHELVRHAVGTGFSQVSQRYVDGKVLRFVMPAEIQGDEALEREFFDEVERASSRYEFWAQRLMEKQGAGDRVLDADQKRDRRKKVNQCARRFLPNCTETSIFMTGCMRAWRNIFEQRANPHADIAIRTLAAQVFYCLRRVAPALLCDYEARDLPDGTTHLTTPFVKI